MAIELLDEHEQSERVRAWLHDNGTAIFGGIALGLALIFGWQWWQRTQAERNVTAAVQYQALVDAAARNDADTVQQMGEALSSEHSGSPYALLASLQRAEQALAAGDAAAAAAALTAARKENTDPASRGLLTLRLARTYMAQGDAGQALSLLEDDALGTYAGLADELRGDALLALGRRDEARSAYTDALEALDVGAPNRSLVEMKLGELGGSATSDATTDAVTAAGDA